jgi:hypothetical protein
MKKFLLSFLLALSIIVAGSAYARTPVINVDDQSDEIENLENQVDKLKKQSAGFQSESSTKDKTISNLRTQITQKDGVIASLSRLLNITDPSITIVSPKAGKTVNSRDTLEVKWRGTNLSGASIDIYMAKKGDQNNPVFVANVPNTGVAVVTLPTTLSDGSYFLSLIAKDLLFKGKPVQRVMKSPFRVVDKTTKTITITSPSTPTTVARGGSIDVSFTTKNISSGTNMSVYLTSETNQNLLSATVLKEMKLSNGVNKVKVTISDSAVIGTHLIAVAMKDATSTVAYTNTVTVTPRVISDTLQKITVKTPSGTVTPVRSDDASSTAPAKFSVSWNNLASNNGTANVKFALVESVSKNKVKDLALFTPACALPGANPACSITPTLLSSGSAEVVTEQPLNVTQKYRVQVYSTNTEGVVIASGYSPEFTFKAIPQPSAPKVLSLTPSPLVLSKSLVIKGTGFTSLNNEVFIGSTRIGLYASTENGTTITIPSVPETLGVLNNSFVLVKNQNGEGSKAITSISKRVEVTSQTVVENWIVDETKVITWKDEKLAGSAKATISLIPDSGSEIRIELQPSKSGETKYQTANDGKHSIVLPKNIPEGNYKVRVTVVDTTGSFFADSLAKISFKKRIVGVSCPVASNLRTITLGASTSKTINFTALPVATDGTALSSGVAFTWKVNNVLQAETSSTLNKVVSVKGKYRAEVKATYGPDYTTGFCDEVTLN